MDFSESTKVVYDRIQKIEPEYVSKIIGYLLLHGHDEHEMIRLAFSPDSVIQYLINKAKTDLGILEMEVSAPISPSQLNQAPLTDLHLQFSSYSPASTRLISSPSTLQSVNSYWDAHVSSDQQPVNNVDFVPQAYSDLLSEDFHLQNRLQFLTLEDQLESINSVSSEFSSSCFYPEQALGVRTSRRSPSLPEFPVKVCHYFSKGFCKHGNNCRYFHGHPMPESFSQIFSPTAIEFANEDHVVSPGPLEKLEMDIIDLLKSRRGLPISIASLPMLYYEKYRRTLQAEGYLTESQRHGKAGYSLTKLLARLKSVCLIDKPHGQHSVILAEDAPKYMEFSSDRCESVASVCGSRQIYLTFPSESTFTEQDVSNYFNKYGPVQDVRIPCQQKRMFGFVTFVYSETVKQILAKGNPHFVCGARVLVKPYREKSRLFERKTAEKLPLPMYYIQNFMEGDLEPQSIPRVCDNSRLLRKQFMEENEQALELERKHSVFQLTPKTSSHHPYFGLSMNKFTLSEEQKEFTSAVQYNYLLDALNQGSTSEDKVRHINTSYSDHDSPCNTQGLNLPDSPFASPIRSGISTVI